VLVEERAPRGIADLARPLGAADDIGEQHRGHLAFAARAGNRCRRTRAASDARGDWASKWRFVAAKSLGTLRIYANHSGFKSPL
jgi:hypothetical protein